MVFNCFILLWPRFSDKLKRFAIQEEDLMGRCVHTSYLVGRKEKTPTGVLERRKCMHCREIYNHFLPKGSEVQAKRGRYDI